MLRRNVRGLAAADVAEVVRLDTGWRLLGTAAGQCASPAELPVDGAWLHMATLGPVASVLKRAGDWADGEPSVRLDASDWWYHLALDEQAVSSRSSETWHLELGGVATLAQLWVNGVEQAVVPNMHLAQQLGLRGLLRPGRNDIHLVCRAMDAALKQRRPRPRWRAPMVENQQLRWFRSSLLGRVPGWSPAVPTVGPWRAMAITRAQGPELSDVRIQATWRDGLARLSVDLSLARAEALGAWVVTVSGQGGRWRLPLTRQADGRWHAAGDLPGAQAWWPHTHGEPVLYELGFEAEAAAGGGAPWSRGWGQIGFRTLVVDQADAGFAIQVNGRGVFARGACWTPLDIVTMDGLSENAYDEALALFKQAGLNMVRVGGTMSYEADAFYDACDRLGILVWQDLMFANMDYPEDPDWVAGVVDEVRQQLARWQGRPCLAVLCGNSEVSQQAAMFGATRDKWAPALFSDTLAEVIGAQAPSLPYWPSSAFGGAFPHQNDEGTTSYYGVGAYMRDPGDARRSGLRFATECLAFANIPEDDGLADMPEGLSLRVHHPTWKRRVPRDLGAGWDFDDVRDHYVAQLFKVDPVQLRYGDHDRYLLLGRLAAHEAAASAVAEWRLRGSRCQGALVWFWRDLWPGAGWGMVDSQGRPKSPFHALRKVCQPRLVHLTEESGNGYAVHLINDSAAPAEGTVEVAIWRDGQTRLALEARPFTVAPGQALRTPLLAWFDWFADWSNFYRFGPAAAQAVVVVWTSTDGRELGRTHAFPTGPTLPLVAGGLEAIASAQADGSVLVSLTCGTLLQFVHPDVPGWVASDAYFHMSPGQTAQVRFTPGPTGARRPFGGGFKALNLQGSAPIRMMSA